MQLETEKSKIRLEALTKTLTDVIELQKKTQQLSLSEVAERARRMTELAQLLRDKMIEPMPKKAAPRFTASQLAEICGFDRNRLNYLIRKDEALPKGSKKGNSRDFSLEEVYLWVAAVRPPTPRPSEAKAPVLAVSNLKGGSTKTTTTMCLAQGLALKGRKVLIIDLDPQASLTELCGIYADIEVDLDETIGGFFSSYLEDTPMESIKPIIKESYWKNISVVPACTAMLGSDFNFPLISRKRPTKQIWTLLREGLEGVRHDFDYILLDTAPSISYTTVNAIMASDTLIQPLVPDSLDFISSIQFWSLFADLTEMFQEHEGNKGFDMIKVLLTKVNYNSEAALIVKEWAKLSYKDWLLDIEIPASAAASSGALSMNTVYDQMSGNEDASKRTIDRLRQPFNELCSMVDSFYSAKWMTV